MRPAGDELYFNRVLFSQIGRRRLVTQRSLLAAEHAKHAQFTSVGCHERVVRRRPGLRTPRANFNFVVAVRSLPSRKPGSILGSQRVHREPPRDRPFQLLGPVLQYPDRHGVFRDALVRLRHAFMSQGVVEIRGEGRVSRQHQHAGGGDVQPVRRRQRVCVRLGTPHGTHVPAEPLLCLDIVIIAVRFQPLERLGDSSRRALGRVVECRPRWDPRRLVHRDPPVTSVDDPLRPVGGDRG